MSYKKLEKAGTDAEKINELRVELSDLQKRSEQEKADYEKALHTEKIKGACKDYASNQKFTSKAAKREFINFMISQNPELKDGKLIGADDLLESYKTDNADSFVSEESSNTPPAPPIDRRQPNAPAPRLTLEDRCRIANLQK